MFSIDDFFRYLFGPLNRFVGYLVSPEFDQGTSRFDRFNRWTSLIWLGIASLVIIIAPIQALSWSRNPFPGILVEHTLVVNSIADPDWSGKAAGLDYPQRVIALNGESIHSYAEMRAILQDHLVGDRISILVETPSDTFIAYRGIVLISFPSGDLIRLFWIAYGIALVYLVVGIVIYWLRGDTRSGRAFVATSAVAAIAMGLLFDISTTHTGTLIWTIALAQIGSVMISMALLFPQELQPVHRRANFRFIATMISIILAVWGGLTLYQTDAPWSYILAWRYSYMYAGFGILIFFGMMIYRLKDYRSAIAHQQARIILWGGLIAFTPIAIWFVIQIIQPVTFEPTLLLPFMIAFPIVLGICIARYRLWDIDIIINRTLVYSTLTLILAVIYIATVLALELIFTPFMAGNQNITVVSTLLIAALFAPLRNRIQRTIDRRFYRRKYNVQKTLEAFGESLRQEVDLSLLNDRLLAVVEETMQPESVSIWVKISKKRGEF